MTTETTTDTVAPALTELEARRLTARIRDALALADDLLAQAFTGGAWKALRPPRGRRTAPPNSPVCGCCD